MDIKEVKTINDIQTGDTIIITDGTKPELHNSVRRKVSELDGVEIIFKPKSKKFFNLGMYVDGKSWVTKAYVVKSL